ncbi:UNVERIFIED_CONTAM: hypothetical protein HDU68_009032 [Siphonaria sp. JEL0065]|nr:hypothetical protein HDU68_009032 [Siphonaria sp. JEL0065]
MPVSHIDPVSLPFTPLPAPPSKDAIVKVSILLNGRFESDPRIFVLDNKALTGKPNPPILDKEKQLFPVFCFLVEKELSDGKVERTLFDLGIRKDTENFSPTTKHYLPFFQPHPTQSPDVVESLAAGGLTVSDIDRVILSHNHFDHVGNPFLFSPERTEFMIGEFNRVENEEKFSKERDGDGEITWKKLLSEDSSVKWEAIGSFERGWDFYGDGSFWIIDAPGHCKGHMIAFARTSTNPDTYMLFAGDAAHAQCLYKTSPGCSDKDTRHPCGLFTQSLQFTPVEDLVLAIHDDLEVAYRTIAKISRMDALDNVLVVAAHEIELDGVVDLFPQCANEWLRKGWKDSRLLVNKKVEGEETGVVGLGLKL